VSDFVILSSWSPENLMLVQHQTRTYLELAGFTRGGGVYSLQYISL